MATATGQRADLTAAEQAAADELGVPYSVVEGYLGLLDAAAGTGRRPNRAELTARRELGIRAAEDGVELRALLEVYLRAAERGWAHLSGVSDAPTASAVRSGGSAALAVQRSVLMALLGGYQDAGRVSAGRDEADRREFIDDLLHGRSDFGRLAERAERFGLRLASSHVVVVARAKRPIRDFDPITAAVDRALSERFGDRNILVTTKEGLLVVLAPSGLRGIPGEFSHQLMRHLGADSGWQVAVGRSHPGAGGIVQSYEEARSTLDLAARLGFHTAMLHAADLLVFPVLLRDQAAITDLVRTVLGPLENARGGPHALLATLSSFFDNQGNVTATARHLELSARTVTYRLDRVHQLTGYAATEPTQRFTLEAAVLGAKLLDWPKEPL